MPIGDTRGTLLVLVDNRGSSKTSSEKAGVIAANKKAPERKPPDGHALRGLETLKMGGKRYLSTGSDRRLDAFREFPLDSICDTRSSAWAVRVYHARTKALV